MHTKINRECNSSYFGNVTNGKDIVSLVTDRYNKNMSVQAESPMDFKNAPIATDSRAVIR